MEEEEFIKIWNKLKEWNNMDKEIYTLGIDLSRHDRHLYDIIISLLNVIYSPPQVDLFIFSIFSENKEIIVESENIMINNANICFEYINKLD